jgi:hypothetical protein
MPNEVDSICGFSVSLKVTITSAKQLLCCGSLFQRVCFFAKQIKLISMMGFSVSPRIM